MHRTQRTGPRVGFRRLPTKPQGRKRCIDNVVTSGKTNEMKTRPLFPIASAVTPVAETKGSINLRIGKQTRQLIDEAASALGKTRTEFMIDSARQNAIDVLLDQRLFVLDPEDYDAFLEALDSPPSPGPKLKALMSRTPAWEK